MMEQLNLPIFVIIIISVTPKFSLMSPTSLERTSMPHETKKNVAFDVGNILTKVEGLSVKIDGLVDLGPKWNFEYTFIPYDKNIARTQGTENESDGANDETTPTTVADRNTENVPTKKKQHKMRAAQPDHSSESSRNSSEASDTSSGHSKEKLSKSSEKTANSSETHKSLEKSMKSSEKSNKSSEKTAYSSETHKSLEKSVKSSEMSKKSSETGGKTSKNRGKTSKKRGKSSKQGGKSSKKRGKSSEKSGKLSVRSGKPSAKSDKSSEKEVKSSEKEVKSSEKSGKLLVRSGKPSGKSDKSSEKEGKSSEKGGKSSETGGKSSEKGSKSSEKGGKSKEKSDKSVRSGKSEKSSEKSGTSAKKSNKTSGKIRKSHIKRHKDKNTKPKHDYIYKDVDNNSLILRSPHKVQDDARLRDFTVHVYKQALRIFDDLKKKFNDTKSNKKIDELIRNYRDKFAEFVNETQYVSVKTRLGTQKVILNTVESSNMILKKLIDHLMADSVQKTVLRNERHDVAGVLEQQLEKEIDVEYRHVCSKFGICRTGYVFSNFVADIIGELIRADDKKLRMAIDATTETLNEQSFNHVLEDQVEKRLRADISVAEKTNVDQLRAILQIFRGILVNKNKPLPVMGSMDSRVMNRSLAVLDLIDLFDDKIKPNEVNKLAWNDLKASCRDWADGSREDTAEIMEAVIRHVMKSGLNKFDAKTIQVLNDKLKIYYDMGR